MVGGDAFATVGISHLTTSRRHLNRPALMATETENGYVLQGQAPWVTGAPHGDLFVIGATMEDGREILVAVPTNTERVRAGRGYNLVALSASCTDRVEFDDLEVDRSMVLSGPIENVLQTGTGAGTGGLQTSTLAIGLARAAANFLADEASRREELCEPTGELAREINQLETQLLRAAGGDPDYDASDIRGAANHLVIRTTQAAMTAAKGAGFIEGHPVGRWCREALFFLVWSCPKPVSHAHLCELAFGVQ
jgi:alkylation response protein AidB-like acyl-CoA dehydrogenase